MKLKISSLFGILVLSIVIILTGCSGDFLEKYPPGMINTANFYKTPKDAIKAVNGAYQPLQWPKLYNLRMWTTDIMAGNSLVGASGGSDGIETKNELHFVTKPDNPGVLDLWRGPWPGILRSNIVLEKVKEMKNIKPDLKNRILGEAHFLRGLYYFILVRFFGAVPMITKPQGPKSNLRPPRTPVEDIYNKIIIPDFKMASKLLPPKSSYDEKNIGRASKGSAMDFLAMVYITIANMQKFAGKNYANQDTKTDYQKAVAYCDTVKQLGYMLDTKYAYNFKVSHNNDQESIFSIQYYGKTKAGFFSNPNQGAWTSTFTGPRNSGWVAGAYGWDLPTQEFVDQYEPGDKRKNVTILYKGGPKFDGKSYNPDWSITGYNLRKFLEPLSIQPTYDSGKLNFRALRYAGILLLKSEALNELGETSAAEVPLNKVRERAGLKDITGSYSMKKFRKIVLHARRLELAFEGKRWFDLIQHPQYALDFLHSIGRLNATKKYFLLPIPQKAIDSNPNLKQNPGY